MRLPEEKIKAGIVAAATLMEQSFPEYKRLHAEAVKTNYGWKQIRNHKPSRLADAFAEDVHPDD